jgi:hypothetical protein
MQANGVPGSYSVTASVAGVSTPATFTLTNNTLPNKPNVQASVTSKSGTFPSRTWTVTITNTGGVALANLAVSGVSIGDLPGTSCFPTIDLPVPSPVAAFVASSGPLTNATIAIPLNFSGCSATNRFAVTLNVTGNSGKLNTQVSLGNQFP